MATYSFKVETLAREELREITDDVAEVLQGTALQEGLCHVFCRHTTAGLTINENADPDVKRDMLYALERIIPAGDPAYRHAEGNSAAHLKASLMGFHLEVPVAEGRLLLGTWQGIFLCEFDGPRSRTVVVSFTESAPEAKV